MKKYPEKIACTVLLLIAASILLHTAKTAVFDISAHSEILPLTDAEDSGTSVIRSFQQDSISAKADFVYGDGYAYPYAGLEYRLSEPVRIGDYSDLRLSVGNMKLKTISIGLFASRLEKPENATWFETEMPIKKKTNNDGRLPLDEFYTPTWWFYNNDIPLVQTDLDDYSCITEFQVRCRKRSDADTGDILIVKSIQLRRGRVYIILRTIFAAAAAALGIAMLFIRNIAGAVRKKLKSNPPILYKKQEISTDREKWDDIIDSRIRGFSNDPEFDQVRACEICGVSGQELDRLVKKFTGHSFPFYLRELRIENAIEMLRSTDKPVTAIAGDSGFRSVSGFNSAFKKNTGYSPSDYRKQNEDA